MTEMKSAYGSQAGRGNMTDEAAAWGNQNTTCWGELQVFFGLRQVFTQSRITVRHGKSSTIAELHRQETTPSRRPQRWSLANQALTGHLLARG